MRFRLSLSEQGLLQLASGVLQLFSEQVGAIARDLHLLLGLCELSGKRSIGIVEQLHATLHFSELGRGLLRERIDTHHGLLSRLQGAAAWHRSVGIHGVGITIAAERTDGQTAYAA